MISSVLFDFDGTLVHTAPGILAVFRKTLDEAGVPAVEPIDERVIGPPLLATLTRLTGIHEPDRLDRIARAFKASYDADGVLQADPYPGLAVVLAGLAADRRRSFVVTNKRQVPARTIALRLGIMPQLAGLYSLDTLTPPAVKKQVVVAHLLAEHGIVPQAAVLVGDSVEDAEAAAANDIRFIAATYGYGSPLSFTTVAPAATLDRLGDLPRVLASLD